MPNRILKESICTSDNLDALSWQAEAFFYRLLVQCDDYGRMDARPAIVRAKCFPLRLDHDECSEQATVEMLADLERCKLIYLYEVDDRPYLQVTTWENHQQIRAKRSKYPQPPSQENILQASDSTCNHVQANVPVIQSNPNPNPRGIAQSTDAKVAKPAAPPTNGKPEPTEQRVMFGIVAEVCQRDMKLQAKRIGQTASKLIAAGYTPEQVQAFGPWWYKNDWRGKRDHAPPTLAQLEESIYQATHEFDPPDDKPFAAEVY